MGDQQHQQILPHALGPRSRGVRGVAGPLLSTASVLVAAPAAAAPAWTTGDVPDWPVRMPAAERRDRADLLRELSIARRPSDWLADQRAAAG